MATPPGEKSTQVAEQSIDKQAGISIPTKRKATDGSTSNDGLPINFTSRKPPWSYLKLQLYEKSHTYPKKLSLQEHFEP